MKITKLVKSHCSDCKASRDLNYCKDEARWIIGVDHICLRRIATKGRVLPMVCVNDRFYDTLGYTYTDVNLICSDSLIALCIFRGLKET